MQSEVFWPVRQSSFEIDLFSFLYMTKTPSEMKVAQRFKLFTLLTLLPQLTLLPPQCSGSNFS